MTITLASDERPHVDPSTTPIAVRRNWDAALQRTALLHPANCHSALLDWHPVHWPDDGGMPVEIALALGSALTTMGTVMGRADEPSRAGPLTTLIPAPSRSLLRHMCDALLRRERAETVAGTDDPAEAAALLDAGWSVQHQAILILSRDGPSDASVEALRYRRDWRDFGLGPPIVALMVPSNDGDGVLFATQTAEILADVLDRVLQALAAAGFPAG